MRAIDADALKETLKKLKAKGYNQKYVQGLQDAIDGYFPQIIDDEPTIEAEPDKDWISVKDRLPENETEVLIYCPEFVCTIKLAMWIEDGFFVEKEDLIIKAAPNGYCTHWQSIPKPPKDDNDK